MQALVAGIPVRLLIFPFMVSPVVIPTGFYLSICILVSLMAIIQDARKVSLRLLTMRAEIKRCDATDQRWP